MGILGSALGVAAGLGQATLGSRIPEWSGAKAAPVPLGLLTIALSLLAGIAAVAQGSRNLTVGWRAVCALGLFLPGALCFSTVGRLWYVPGPLLLIAGLRTIDDWRGTASEIARNWSRCLLGALGAAELLMAAGAAPPTMAAGGVGGIALIAAAWPGSRNRTALLLLVGTVPFAALAWTAVVPLLLDLVAVALTAPLLRSRAKPAKT